MFWLTLHKLRSAKPNKRKDAVFELSRSSHPRAPETLVELLRDPEVGSTARNALYQSKDARAADRLLSILDDPDPVIVGRAVSILGEIREARAVPPLLEMLSRAGTTPGERLKNARADVIGALNKIGDKRAIAPLMELLLDESFCNDYHGGYGDDFSIRRAIIYAVAAADEPSVYGALLNLKKNESIASRCGDALDASLKKLKSRLRI